MAYEIMTDTSCDLPWDYYGKLNIVTLSLTVTMGSEQMNDDENVDAAGFYKKLRGGSVATTSQITAPLFMERFSEILARGNDVFYAGLSSGLSGSYQSACLARDELKDSFPGKRIYVGNSACVTLGMGNVILALCGLRDSGADLDEAIRFFEETQICSHHLFTVDDLMFLMRGGRVSRASAVVGSLLGIKPMLHVNHEGKLIAHGKVRGRRKSLDSLVEEMAEFITGTELDYVSIAHGDCLEDAEYVMNKVKDRYTVKNSLIRILGPTIGAHSGPGTVALFFFGTPRVK